MRPIARSRNARVFLQHSAPYVDALTPTDRGSVWLTSAQCVYDDLHATWSIRLCGEVLHVYDREGLPGVYRLTTGALGVSRCYVDCPGNF